jgi:hypothetical protein
MTVFSWLDPGRFLILLPALGLQEALQKANKLCGLILPVAAWIENCWLD